MSEFELDPDFVEVNDLEASPKRYDFLHALDLDQDVNRRLNLLLSGIESGNSDVYLTPLAKHLPPNTILGMWDNVFNSNIDSINDALLDLEESNRSKYGPRSIAKKWSERKTDVLAYYKGRPKHYSPRFGKSDSDLLLPNSLSLRPISLERGVKYLKNNTNSGLPFYCRKSKVKERLIRDFTELSLRSDPCILFTRTQEQGKTRNVWGFPIIDTLKETCFYQPLLSYQKKLSWRAAICSPKETDIAVTRMINEALSDSSKVIISIDFSAFDASVPQHLIDESFKYILSLYQPKFWTDIEHICHRFNTIELLTPSGVMSGCHGVPSGSTFTNEVDSLVQYFASFYTSVKIYDFQIQGDDGLYLIDIKDVSKFIEGMTKQGFLVNEQKTLIDQNSCSYLQRLYHTDYLCSNGVIGGIYSTYRALCRLIYQERWSKFEDFGLTGSDYYSIRAISILENVKYHPLHKELVKFVLSLDKYNLKFDPNSIAKYVLMLQDGTGSGGLLDNQYGDSVGGIANFETVKIIKSLA